MRVTSPCLAHALSSHKQQSSCACLGFFLFHLLDCESYKTHHQHDLSAADNATHRFPVPLEVCTLAYAFEFFLLSFFRFNCAFVRLPWNVTFFFCSIAFSAVSCVLNFTFICTFVLLYKYFPFDLCTFCGCKSSAHPGFAITLTYFLHWHLKVILISPPKCVQGVCPIRPTKQR